MIQSAPTPNRHDPKCNAKTRQGTVCQKSPLRKKTLPTAWRLSTGPRTAEGKARIAATHYKHGKRSKAFTEMRKKIWAELREVEARMRDDGLI